MFESSLDLPDAAELAKNSQDLAHRIVELAANISSHTAHLIGLITEFDRQQAWLEWGCASTAEWLSWQCAQSRMTSREQVRVARALTRLPQLAAAFRSGEISYSKVRAVTRIADQHNESELTEAALRLSAAQLEGLVRARRRGKAVTDPTYAIRHRSVRRWNDDDGMINVLARLAPEDGELFWRGLEAVEDATGVSAETDDQDLEGAPVAERRRADALVALARGALDGKASGRRSARALPLALVHIEGRDATMRLSDGAQISTKTRPRRWLHPHPRQG